MYARAPEKVGNPLANGVSLCLEMTIIILFG